MRDVPGFRSAGHILHILYCKQICHCRVDSITSQQSTPISPPKVMPHVIFVSFTAMRAYSFGRCCQFAEKATYTDEWTTAHAATNSWSSKLYAHSLNAFLSVEQQLPVALYCWVHSSGGLYCHSAPKLTHTVKYEVGEPPTLLTWTRTFTKKIWNTIIRLFTHALPHTIHAHRWRVVRRGLPLAGQ